MKSQGSIQRAGGGSESVVGDMTIEIRGWNDVRKESQVKECEWPPETEKGRKMKSPLKLPEGKLPCQHLDFRLLISTTARE